MIVLDPESWFVKYWIRWGCTRYGYNKILKLPPYNDEEYSRRSGLKTGTNLCQLGRICIYAFTKTLLIGLLAAMLFSFLIFHPIQFASIVGTISFCLAVGSGVVYMLKYLHDKIEGNTTKPNLFVEWVKAKKGKFCPRIEFMQPSSTSSNISESSS